jgi:3-deoxy-D-manno-octulosonate 8-phosphate phosphatase (KDO 8-P phosphatase)
MWEINEPHCNKLFPHDERRKTREDKSRAMDDLAVRAAKIELLILDVDGVLTDGSIIYTNERMEIKRFHVRDGSGLKFWHLVGKRSAIISGRTSIAVEHRALELGVSTVIQGCDDKLTAFETVLRDAGFQADQVCAVGDDLPDLSLLRASGLGVAVADACPEVRDSADHITTAPGGRGAVREVIEWLLKHQGMWDGVVQSNRRGR